MKIELTVYPSLNCIVLNCLSRRSSGGLKCLLVVFLQDGIPPRTAEVPVVVGIIDSNDEGPRFSMPQYNGTVSEDATTGTTVLAIQAVDLDAVSYMLI